MSTILFLLLATYARAITFDLYFGEQKCFGEDFLPRTSVKGDVHVSTGRGGADMKLDVVITNSKQVVVFHRAAIHTAKFSFTTGEYKSTTSQPYRICVRHQVPSYAARPPTDIAAYRRVTLSLHTPRTSQDIAKLASRAHVNRTSQSFREVSFSLERLLQAMHSIRSLEQHLSDIGNSTATLVVCISLLASLFTILTGVLNFMYLKNFFKHKKLI